MNLGVFTLVFCVLGAESVEPKPVATGQAEPQDAKTATQEPQKAQEAQKTKEAEKVQEEKESEEEDKNVFDAQDIVITGTRSERKLEKAPIKTQLIDRKQLEAKHAFNLADALEMSAGVRVESSCQNCGFTQVRLNGLDGHYTQILIDGRPVNSSLAMVYLLEQIPEELIERIEIIKGGGSALYGGSAIAGVINVITKRPVKNFASMTLQSGAMDMSASDTNLGMT
ncbi:TonB-dependent receptor plug domain-containing protein, partial [Myxococcota bacterium]|nr:TonB-dependent receptor plug domain-containing protein [Myxococcota bacterium]